MVVGEHCYQQLLLAAAVRLGRHAMTCYDTLCYASPLHCSPPCSMSLLLGTEPDTCRPHKTVMSAHACTQAASKQRAHLCARVHQLHERVEARPRGHARDRRKRAHHARWRGCGLGQRCPGKLLPPCSRSIECACMHGTQYRDLWQSS